MTGFFYYVGVSVCLLTGFTLATVFVAAVVYKYLDFPESDLVDLDYDQEEYV